MKVLVIDDDKFARTVYESELHQENIAVELASDGEEGLAKAKALMPDLIIMELILTRRNGFEVIAALKSHAKLKKIPIVVCSSLSQKTDIEEATKLGITKYLSKEDYSLKQVIKEVMNVLMSL